MSKLSIDSVNFKNKKVLVRVDFNVPLDENQNITNDIRIKASYQQLINWLMTAEK